VKQIFDKIQSKHVFLAVITILAFLVAREAVRATNLPGLERAPIYAAGAAEEITSTTSASDASAELEQPANYWLYCPQDSYCRWGATAPTAAAGDFIITARTYWPFATGGSAPIKYVACKNVSVSASCWIIEAR
jgi:hypothetical protein